MAIGTGVGRPPSVPDPSSPQRRKGRPAATDQKVGSDTILDAARKLLLRLPSAHVTTAAVAREAGVDPALIRYYFKDRASLLRAVAEAVVVDSLVHQGVDPARPAGEQLKAFAVEFFGFVAANPFMHRLMLDELAHAAAPEHRAVVATLNRKVCDYIGGILALGLARGEMRPAEPLLVYLALVGMCEFYGAAGPIIDGVLGPDVDKAALAARQSEFISSLLVAGLRP